MNENDLEPDDEEDPEFDDLLNHALRIGHAGLSAQEPLSEAIERYRRAIELDPHDADALTDLGHALETQGNVEEGIESYQHAIDADPNYAPAHFNLGDALRGQGKLEAALENFRRAHEIFSGQSTVFAGLWGARAAKCIKSLALLLSHEDELLALVHGERRAAPKKTWIAAAQLARLYNDVVGSARTYSRAFAEHPALLTDPDQRYDAARVAALAGTPGSVSDEHTDTTRVAFRQQALDWLRADLRHWQDELASGADRVREVLRHLRLRQKNEDLGGIRDDHSLKLLPTSEASTWRAFWREVADTVERGESRR